jgi:hypothetical protein
MKFKEWLKHNLYNSNWNHNNGILEDLAWDIIHDKDFPDHDSLLQLFRYVRYKDGACIEAKKAMAKLIKHYKKEREKIYV